MNNGELILTVAALAACAYICVEKWGFIEWLQLHAGRIRPLRPDCTFCTLFYFSVVITILLSLFFTISFFYLVAPFAATPIAKAIYENSKAK